MINIRCHCGKIVCQLENVAAAPPQVPEQADGHPEPGVVILCRHCRSYVILRVPAIFAIYSRAPVANPRLEMGATASPELSGRKL